MQLDSRLAFMSNDIGREMYGWATNLFPINRSLTGNGVRETLEYLKSQVPELVIHQVASGTSAFDWVVPDEWTINEAYIDDENGQRVLSLVDNNLHVLGYSTPVDKVVTREELDDYLYSLPDQPKAIPYVTSYYERKFGFCMTQEQRDSLSQGPFHIFIDSRIEPGFMNYGEVYIPGASEKEVLFSTYICHPSMANNELSGPVVALALAKHLSTRNDLRYSYRFVFTVETIGSIYYISKHLKELQANVVAGWVLTCMGDDRTYSFIPSRHGNTLTDRVSRKVLRELNSDFTEYTWLDRGSDERQFCSPGVDLPVASIMRSKYEEYPEYHTSLDNLDVISPNGLQGSYNALERAIQILESNNKWKILTKCEPQLGKRGLYPNTSTKNAIDLIRNQMNVISYLDGENDVIEISEKCKIDYRETLKIIEMLNHANLVERISS
jgi:aminopeptidase-like protein